MNSSELLLILVDLVILVTVIECLGMGWWHRKTGRGVPLADFGLNLLSGLSLMLALRLVLTQASPWLVMGALLMAGLLHGLDMLRRWRR
jgi:uncharacterized membrane protein SirB2